MSTDCGMERPRALAVLRLMTSSNLVGMALLFFLLFYTFPAGMVLYWTSTNALQLASRELGRLRRRRPSARPPAQ